MQREMETRQRVTCTAAKVKKDLQGFLRSHFRTVARWVETWTIPGNYYAVFTSRSLMSTPTWSLLGASPHWFIAVHSQDMGQLWKKWPQISYSWVRGPHDRLAGIGSPTAGLCRGQELSRSQDVNPEQALQRLPAPAWLRWRRWAGRI